MVCLRRQEHARTVTFSSDGVGKIDGNFLSHIDNRLPTASSMVIVCSGCACRIEVWRRSHWSLAHVADKVMAGPAVVNMMASPLSPGWKGLVKLCRAVQAFPFKVMSMDAALLQATFIFEKGNEHCE